MNSRAEGAKSIEQVEKPDNKDQELTITVTNQKREPIKIVGYDDHFEQVMRVHW